MISITLQLMLDIQDVCKFAESDPYGILMAIIGMGIVFSVLALIYLIFNNTPKLFETDFKTLFSKKKKQQIETLSIKEEAISGEVSAAIATALYLYKAELHDEENTVLTIKKVTRSYSPWSSKIYGLRNFPK